MANPALVFRPHYRLSRDSILIPLFFSLLSQEQGRETEPGGSAL